MNHHYIAIMAGGIGSRFWPQSREAHPKQFLDILGTGETLIQTTYRRFARLVPEDHIYIITGERYISLVKEQIPNIKDEQILAEPARKNTAPCVAYMAFKLAAKDPEGTFVIAPSDHLITEPEKFLEIIDKSLNYAAKNSTLMTLGIKPHQPHTGYGYIQYDENQGEEGIYKVKTFTEKPSLEMAKTFLNSGEFLWNSGIFVWNVKAIIKAFKKYQPGMFEIFSEGKKVYNTPKEKDFIKKTYGYCPSISIDYGSMEHAENVRVIPSSFGWSDLGTWLALWEKHAKDYMGNAVEGKNVMIYNSENCMVMVPDKKLVILQDLQDYCVVDTDDVLLVFPLAKEQNIKKFNKEARKTNGDTFM